MTRVNPSAPFLPASPAALARLLRVGLGTLAFIGVAGLLQPALAEDTDTPGDGHWEIKVGSSGARTSEGWEIAAPEVEVNYGLTETTQLTAVVPWIIKEDTEENLHSGLGAGTLGFKWRFVDQDASGYSMSIFPQYSWNLLLSSEKRGIVSPGKQFFLPVEVGFELGKSRAYLELGRNFVQHGTNNWAASLEANTPCTATIECALWVAQSFPADDPQTLVKVGVKWHFREGLTFNAGVGRDFGRKIVDQRDVVYHVGIELTK